MNEFLPSEKELKSRLALRHDLAGIASALAASIDVLSSPSPQLATVTRLSKMSLERLTEIMNRLETNEFGIDV